MRREQIKYLGNIPVHARLLKIKNYPLHWNKALTIMWAIEGSLYLKVESEKYRVLEREVEVINPDEVFEVKSENDSATVLILEFDLAYFSKYYKDATSLFFYTNLPGDNLDDERYLKLKRLISEIVYEYIYRLDGYETKIEDSLVDIFYHLLNNFHYLFSEEESLKDDEELLNRYHRIVKNLSNNYNENVRLLDIAKSEYLTPQYLSTKIKEIFGKTFNEYLNQIRAEEATKLILDSDMNMSEIASEVGFSHIRYFNKHFKLNYNMTPMEYKKTYKLTQKEYENQKKVEELDLKLVVPSLKTYLTGYQRLKQDDKVYMLDLDMQKEVEGEFRSPDLLDLGDVSLVLEKGNQDAIRWIKKNTSFKYCYIRNLFSSEMDIYKGKNDLFINWNRVENVLETILGMKFIPIINSSETPKYIIRDFLEYFSGIYDEENVNSWLNADVKALNPIFMNEEIDDDFDNLSGAIFDIENYVNENKRVIPIPMDEIYKETNLTNDTFFGGSGLFTSNQIQKPRYFAFQFLSKLGEEILDKGEDFIFTKSDRGYALLIFNDAKKNNSSIKKYSINLYNLESDCLITRYELSKNFGSSFATWEKLGGPVRLSNRHWDLLKRYSFPQVRISSGKKAGVFNMITEIQENAVILYTIENTDM